MAGIRAAVTGQDATMLNRHKPHVRGSVQPKQNVIYDDNNTLLSSSPVNRFKGSECFSIMVTNLFSSHANVSTTSACETLE